MAELGKQVSGATTSAPRVGVASGMGPEVSIPSLVGSPGMISQPPVGEEPVPVGQAIAQQIRDWS